jgi:hypothetical protein
MHDTALEIRHAFPLGRIAFRVPVVALAHEEKVCRELRLGVAVTISRSHRPEVAIAGPRRLGDLMLIPNVVGQPILVDDLSQIS